MAIPTYSVVSIMSYSPLAGIRRATGVPMVLLKDADERNATFRAVDAQLTGLTKQPDPKRRLEFGFWALDNAPSPELKDRVPLEVMIVHYVRTLPAWPTLGHSPALNIVTLDWPVDGGYEIRAFLVGTDEPMPPEQLRFFYEQQRELVKTEISSRMPAVRQ
ncbi:hypothetical protein [Pseudomonas asiatica]|uniref:hypothetical protein n=1 Tax=Pseudomonas asiatica TaxID=2219225 RepID=UPI0010C0A144|nr:hypothetical protein [Pseudomonas asiatica]